MKTMLFRSIFYLFAFCLVLVVRAEDLGAVKVRIEQRLPQIKELKAKGAIGENNRGLLEMRGGKTDGSAVVAAENQDRETVYAAVAQKNGISAEQVGKARAAKIAQNCLPGEWVQDEAGTWKKK